ncbi:branched-chain amino acid ABC transporter permease [Sinisalibacter aestuarii]|uniref:Branched-chain amino acid ABC transporter permease n=1 Tax=Sinisalibacter aestuarii TaxID=2949426 RepID=A0ABQ5LX90_9RHOB|nr:branched-chain amino acid ABC transporter permease [Sinisalibacter aestuarii]GKY89584.1 branched-chain amino acid ABC transporter permease [Sinisalibacter aestuarii]
MIQFYYAYQPIIDFFLLSVGFGYSQQIALRAGVFSIATAGFAAIGAYTVAILVTKSGFPIAASVVLGMVIAGVGGLLLSLPLARLRGAFQAIATLAFVQIVISLLLYAEDFTGGALGVTGIPRVMNTGILLVIVAVVMYVMWSIGRTGLGRIFDALRQEESVAASLGVNIGRYHALAFILSGAVGGLFGGLQSLYVFQIEPHNFGFAFMVNVLTVVILGGRTTLLGPIMGAAIMAILPELARPLAEYRPAVNGVILILVITFLPNGVGDEIVFWFRRRRHAAAAANRAQAKEAKDAVTSS